MPGPVIRPEDVTPIVARRVLNFLNTARKAEEIAQAVEISGERDVGLRVAERILERRDKLGMFTSIHQVAEVEQIGPERFSEIISALRAVGYGRELRLTDPEVAGAIVGTVERVFKAYRAGHVQKRELNAILTSSVALQQVPSPLFFVLPDFLSRLNRGKLLSAQRLFQQAIISHRLMPVAALAPAITAGAVIIFILEILAAIATIVTIILGIRELAEAIEGSPDTEQWDTWRGEHTFDSKNVHIKKIACNTTITDVEDGVVVIMDEIPAECTVTIMGNDGIIRIKDNKGTVDIQDNDDQILVDNNNGTINVNGNDDTVVVDNNNGTTNVNANEDTIGVNNNTGNTNVNGNDDTVNVNNNNSGGSITVNGNDDIVNINDNDGAVNVEGNSGGILDDADVNVVDNSVGTINANNNDGNVNVGADSQGNQGTINRGNKPGDVNRL